MRSALTVLISVVAVCGVFSQHSHAQHVDEKISIYWSDGDSGRLNGLKFRLANIDAPETGSLKQRGGAKCETERKIGYAAKAFLVEFTRRKDIRIIRDYGEDRYGRLVVDMSANGVNVAQAGIDAGHLKAWPHRNGRQLAKKPDWCR